MWHLASLVHDAYSEEIARFFKTAWTDGVHVVVAPLWNTRNRYDKEAFDTQDIIRETKGLADLPTDGNVVTVYGHGNYHHYTYGITHHVMIPRSKRFMYAHIDYHTDDGMGSFRKKDGKEIHALSCGSFTRAIKNHGARAYMYIGTDVRCGTQKKRIKQDTIEMKSWSSSKLRKPLLKNFIMTEARKKRTKDTYVSIDLDVVRYEDCATGYQQGKISLEDILEIVEALKDCKNVVAADILGYQRALSQGYHRTEQSKSWLYYNEMSKLTYLILASKFAGKDFHEAMKLRHWILKKHNHKSNGVDVADLLLDFRV